MRISYFIQYSLEKQRLHVHRTKKKKKKFCEELRQNNESCMDTEDEDPIWYEKITINSRVT